MEAEDRREGRRETLHVMRTRGFKLFSLTVDD